MVVNKTNFNFEHNVILTSRLCQQSDCTDLQLNFTCAERTAPAGKRRKRQAATYTDVIVDMAFGGVP
jgi:hypothetical protein